MLNNILLLISKFNNKRYGVKRDFDEKSDMYSINFFFNLSGKSFGIPHDKFKNTYQHFSLGRTVKYDAEYTPGPGKYNFIKDIGNDR